MLKKILKSIVDNMKKRVHSFMCEYKGSMTLEATFILPMLLTMLFIMISIGIVLLKVNTYQFVQLTAVERAAFNWDEYDREFSTGIRQSTYRYGLYEHDTMLMMLNQLIKLNKPISYYNMSLDSSDEAAFSGTLKQDKLSQLNAYMQGGEHEFTGSVAFEQRNFMPRIVLRTEPTKLLLSLQYKANSSALLLDPTQHIRGVDLLVYYSEKISSKAKEKDAWLQKMKEVMPAS